jgi:hypothetical protein
LRFNKISTFNYKSIIYRGEFGLSPVTLPSCAMTTFRLKIKKLKKIKNRTLKAVIWTAPSPVQYGHEGIHSLWWDTIIGKVGV